MSQDIPVPLPEPRYYIDGCMVVQPEAIEQWARACMAPLQERADALEAALRELRLAIVEQQNLSPGEWPFKVKARLRNAMSSAGSLINPTEGESARMAPLQERVRELERKYQVALEQIMDLVSQRDAAEAELSRLKAQPERKKHYIPWVEDALNAAPPSQEQT